MDLRITKTRAAVKNAFLEIRASKPLEKITVKELSAAANINKATFYLHYKDIYNLSEILEREIIHECLYNGPDPNDIFENVTNFINSLCENITANKDIIEILFEGTRSNSFPELFIEEMYKLIEENFPDYEATTEDKMKMTFLVEGAYHTLAKFSDFGIDKVLGLLAEMSAGTIASVKK
ncbi:MAG: TetR/AcrR family transcriptional regulator [Ruminococcus sp.]|nr:TetR/AcrR family transcriptional regulator [Ruminococcus sp.]